MKLKFKTQAYQTAAVQAVVDCFAGQPPAPAEAMSSRRFGNWVATCRLEVTPMSTSP